MFRHTAQSLWLQFCDLWLTGDASVADPRLAADAGQAPIAMPRYLSPLVGAWLH